MAAHAVGTFEVRLDPQTPSEKAQPANLGRLSINKKFNGDLEAVSNGEMLAASTHVEGSAGYVALERVSGSLQGRHGTFVLQHNGLMARGAASLSIVVVPDSGSDQLAGLAGQMTIQIEDGKHSYDFEYSFQDAR